MALYAVFERNRLLPPAAYLKENNNTHHQQQQEHQRQRRPAIGINLLQACQTQTTLRAAEAAKTAEGAAKLL